MASDATIFVVDDDEAVRDSLGLLLESAGYKVETFASGPRFLERATSLPFGCVLLDVRMPEISGVELQTKLGTLGVDLPIIVMTGHADVPTAVQTMKAGAVDFVEKPFADDAILQSVARALDRGRERRREAETAAQVNARLALLTEREREVFDELLLGRPNKVIAAHLNISPRTVEIHRARVLDKMQVHNLPDLVRMALAAKIPIKG